MINAGPDNKSPSDIDQVFQALAHPTRREIIDFVRENSGCTVSEICQLFDISRIAVSKHIKLLEQARLLIVEKEGRHSFHYFNVMPIQMIYERWTDEYSAFFARKLQQFKQQLETDLRGDSDEKTA